MGGLSNAYGLCASGRTLYSHSGIGTVTVGVPYSMNVGLTAIDDGQVYDSTVR